MVVIFNTKGLKTGNMSSLLHVGNITSRRNVVNVVNSDAEHAVGA